MIGTFVQSVVMLTDAAFISELGTHAYGAVGNAGLLYVSLLMLSMGISDSGQIMIARRNGEGNLIDIGRTFRHNILILLSFSLFIFAIYSFFTESFLKSSVSDPKVAGIMTDFLDYRKYGVFFEAIRLGIISFYIGIGRTRIIIYATLILALGNIFLDYALIFGNFGFPELGVEGAAVASTIAEGISMIFMLSYLIMDKNNAPYRLFSKIKIDKDIIQKFLKISPPLMAQGFIAMAAWYIFFSIIEEMGPEELEISHVIKSLYFIAFIPLQGLNSTTKTLVSSLIGANRTDLISLLLKRINMINVFALFFILHGILFYPDYMVGLVNRNPDLLEEPERMQIIADLFKMIFGSMLLIGIVSPYFHFINGTGNTKMSFLVEASAIGIYLISAYTLVMIVKADLIGVWAVEYIYFGSLGIFSFLYFKFADWKNIEV